MRTLYIVIVLLAFLGILINGSPEQSTENKTLDRTVGRNNPHEFHIPPHNDTPLKDDVNTGDIVADKFDVIGNKLLSSSDNGLKPGKLLVNTNGKNNYVPTTRLSDFASASALVAKEPLMNYMPAEEAVNISKRMPGPPGDVFPEFDLGALIPITPRDDVAGGNEIRETKATPFLGGVYDQQNEINQKDQAIDTAPHNVINIIKDNIQRNTKTLSFFETVDRHQGETAAKRSEANISHVFDKHITISDKPDITSLESNRASWHAIEEQKDKRRADFLDILNNHNVDHQNLKRNY